MNAIIELEIEETLWLQVYAMAAELGVSRADFMTAAAKHAY